MSTPTLEERVTALEAKLEQIQQKKQGSEVEEPRGWRRIVGRFANMPGFEEAVQLGREWRESYGPPDDESIN